MHAAIWGCFHQKFRVGFGKPRPATYPRSAPPLLAREDLRHKTGFRPIRTVRLGYWHLPPFSQLEGALSKWTSYQDDIRQFSSWMDGVEGSLSESERQHTELRDKVTALGKAKVRTGLSALNSIINFRQKWPPRHQGYTHQGNYIWTSCYNF